jgi:hypothetical protein
MSHYPSTSFLALALGAGLAVSAAAAGDIPQRRPVAGAALGAAVVVPSPDPGAPARTVGATPPQLTAEQRALLEIREQGRREVEALRASLQGLPEGAAQLALLRRIEEVKRQTWIEALRTRATFARQRGDLAAAQEAERLDEALRRQVSQAALAKGAQP